MAAATTQWRCDTCGDPIVKVVDGWVEWLEPGSSTSGKKPGRGLRLVHQNKNCQYDERREHATDGSILCDMQLSHYLGADGLTSLLSLSVDQSVPQEEVIEMIKRLHTPGYELVRPILAQAIADGVIEPNMPKGLHWQRDIDAVTDWGRQNNLI